MWRVMIEVLEKSWNFQSSIGNTVRDYFKDTVTPHFFNVATRCIVLIKTAFSQARHPAPPSSFFLRNKKTPTIHTTCKITHVSSIIIKVYKAGTRKLIKYTTLRKLSLNCHFIQTDFAMDTKLWDIWAYFRSMEMYTAKRSNEIVSHNVKGA